MNFDLESLTPPHDVLVWTYGDGTIWVESANEEKINEAKAQLKSSHSVNHVINVNETTFFISIASCWDTLQIAERISATFENEGLRVTRHFWEAGELTPKTVQSFILV